MTDTISIPADLIINVATLSVNGTSLTLDFPTWEEAVKVYHLILDGAPTALATVTSTGNVFRDLGLPDADRLLAEADARIAAEDETAARTMDDLKHELGTKTSAETFRAVLALAKRSVMEAKEAPMLKIEDAVGEVIASFMKRDTLDHYRRERDEGIGLSDPTCTGHYEGCLAEAEEFIVRLRMRGFTVMRSMDAAKG